ncbi:LuxR C-terminal-related transcriptional regulator [Kitasatospora sp. NPDC088346]|uniref:LuxR C-terminal-related transcriptional regulator n=1 Tax=Kitasatospora sp. NPDC088346 TaxID=3364073 RepID=UPI0037F7995B
MESTPSTPGAGIPRLTRAEARAYAHAVDAGSITPDALLAELGRTEPGTDGEPVVERLLALHLLRRSATEPRQLVPVSPHLAYQDLVASIEREISQLQREMEVTRADLAPLQEVYERGNAQHLRVEAVRVVTDLAEVRRIITELAGECQSEVMTSQPGGARDEEVLHESLAKAEALLERGVGMRTLYQHSAQFSPATITYAEHVVPLGAEIRTLGDGFMRMIVFDQHTAILPLRDDPLGALIVQEPNLVGFAAATFERAWTMALPFPSRYDRDQVMAISTDIKMAVIRMLAQGLDDKVIARRMGISLRTCQRHVAEIMERLGARSRVHLGFLISERNVFGHRPHSEGDSVLSLKPGEPAPGEPAAGG